MGPDLLVPTPCLDSGKILSNLKHIETSVGDGMDEVRGKELVGCKVGVTWDACNMSVRC